MIVRNILIRVTDTRWSAHYKALKSLHQNNDVEMHWTSFMIAQKILICQARHIKWDLAIFSFFFTFAAGSSKNFL